VLLFPRLASRRSTSSPSRLNLLFYAVRSAAELGFETSALILCVSDEACSK
jgi:hypothetical protein